MAGLVASGGWLGCTFPPLARDDMVTTASSFSKHLPQTQFLHQARESIDTRMACHDSSQEAHMTCLCPREQRSGGSWGGRHN